MSSTSGLPSIAILGYGKMGEALAKGIIKARISRRLLATDELPDRLDAVKKAGIEAFTSNSEAVKNADVVIIAVKPGQVGSLLREVSGEVGEHHVIISIAAGVTLKYLEGNLPSAKFIRAMPNITATVGEAITALASGRLASNKDLEQAKAIFNAVGRCVVLNEKLMDTVTGLSASGPAYLFLIIEALAEGGLRLGMPYELALQFAAQTTLGAARMVLETQKHPAELKEMVTTPGGTTIAGLYEMEKAGLRAVLMKAVEKASKRAKQISDELTKP